MNANSKPKTPDQIQAEIDKTGKPLAYIEGFAYFYGRKFLVSPAVLIPRPETEDIVNVAKALGSDFSKSPTKVLDLCTGSGIIGISLKLENPNLNITCSDISAKALKIAEKNAKNLNAKVKFLKSNLFHKLKNQKFDIIATNPPYVDKTWKWLDKKSLRHEPKIALYAKNHGLKIIQKILEQSPGYLTPKGYLLLEADTTQHPEIIKLATRNHLTHLKTQNFILSFQKTAQPSKT